MPQSSQSINQALAARQGTHHLTLCAACVDFQAWPERVLLSNL